MSEEEWLDVLQCMDNPAMAAIGERILAERDALRARLEGVENENGRLANALNRMQEFHDCMEAQRKDEPLPEGE